jgi:2-dehydropantoate 2-reductase
MRQGTTSPASASTSAAQYQPYVAPPLHDERDESFGEDAMRILVVGAGVIGTVYGAHLGACGHTIRVLTHGARTSMIAARGLQARDMNTGTTVQTPALVVDDAGVEPFDLVLVSVRRDQLAGAAPITTLVGSPTVLWFGNNPAGHNGLPHGHPGHALLGFPGIGGAFNGSVAEYIRITQQPTALPDIADPRLDEFSGCMRDRGFAVQRVGDMDGWLVYHAAFVACVAAALTRCDTDSQRLAHDRGALSLMCTAITEAFTELRPSGSRWPATQPSTPAPPAATTRSHQILGCDDEIADGRTMLRRPYPARQR